MRNLLLCGFMLAACYFQAATSACIDTYDCSGADDGEIFADPDNCAKYVVCYAGRAIKNSCPSGLLFDRRSQMCNAASRVSCGSRAVTSDCAPTTTPCNTQPPPCDCHGVTTTPECHTPSPTTPKHDCSTPATKPDCKTTTKPNCNTPPSTPDCITTTKPNCNTPTTTPPCATTTKPNCNTPTTTTCKPDCTTSAPDCSTAQTTPAGVDLKNILYYEGKQSCAKLPDKTFLIRKKKPISDLYYECKSGKVLKRRCGSGEFFNYTVGSCAKSL